MLPVDPLKPTKSSPRIVHHALDVKGWLAAPPSVESARPGACVVCGEASRPVGGDLGLHGHGLRDRQVRGPIDPDGKPIWVVVPCRRYACCACEAILTVVPRGVAPRRQYGYAAIALALTLWQLVRVPARVPVAEVRRRVCAWPISHESPSRWPVLRRWARAARETLGDARLSPEAAAERWAQTVIGRAPPDTRAQELWVQAFAGGSGMS